MTKQTQSKNLPDGWVWHEHDDSSGGLRSPDGKSYFGFDLMTREYHHPRWGWSPMCVNDSLAQVKALAEKWVQANVLKPSLTETLKHAKVQAASANKTLTQLGKEADIAR